MCLIMHVNVSNYACPLVHVNVSNYACQCVNLCHPDLFLVHSDYDECREAEWDPELVGISSMCQNGGKCEDQLHIYKCWCDEFYTGRNCERS